MRYYSYNELHDDGVSNLVITKSEDDIYREYFPYWQSRMIAKFGKEVVEKDYCFEDCLTDWIVVNWAWEVKN